MRDTLARSFIYATFLCKAHRNTYLYSRYIKCECCINFRNIKWKFCELLIHYPLYIDFIYHRCHIKCVYTKCTSNVLFLHGIQSKSEKSHSFSEFILIYLLCIFNNIKCTYSQKRALTQHKHCVYESSLYLVLLYYCTNMEFESLQFYFMWKTIILWWNDL